MNEQRRASKTDEAPAENKTPPRGRNGDGERNSSPAARNDGSAIVARQSYEPRDKWGSLF